MGTTFVGETVTLLLPANRSCMMIASQTAQGLYLASIYHRRTSEILTGVVRSKMRLGREKTNLSPKRAPGAEPTKLKEVVSTNLSFSTIGRRY